MEKEGVVEFIHGGESFRTFFKQFGDSDTASACTPLIVLHGGPGLVHDYLSVFSELAKHDMPVILYDQLGNGKSTRVSDKPASFWTIDLFIDELVNLIRHLGIENAFNLAGHSWGGIIAMEFAIRRRPVGLKRLILSNSLASSNLRYQSSKELLDKFPEDVKKDMKAGMKDPNAFSRALKAFHAIHGCRLRPVPESYWYTLDQGLGPDGNLTVPAAQCVISLLSLVNGISPYLQHFAPVTPRMLKDWSVIDRLDMIRTPTMIINGKYDIAQDFVVQPLFDNISYAKWVTFEKSSHTPFLEETEKYFRIVSQFLLAT